MVLCILYLSLGWLPLLGLKVLGPQEALVLTLFGNYIGTLKGEGFYFVNPFCTAVNPAAKTQLSQSGDVDSAKGSKVLAALGGSSVSLPKEAVTKKISLKIMTLSNARQKINDCLGNPVEIGIAVTWRVVDTGKAVFDVDNYKEFLSLQCDSALRNIVRLYPYDVSPGVDTTGDGVPDEGSLRGSSDVVAARIREEIQAKVQEAGLEILEARITHLAYASEIAAAMLQRQQASAIIDARKMIVEGAVGTVEMALERLNQSGVVELDEEREKALNIALNKISGDWDKDKLMLLISDLQGADFDVSLTGFDPAEIDDLFKDSLKDGVKDDEFDVDAELQKPTITKARDVWTLGRHRLVCGDSTKPETFALLMEGLKSNLVITDPPYNVNYEGGAGKIKNDNMENAAFYNFLLATFQNTEEAMADDASIYVFHADTEGLNFRKAFSDAGFYLSGTCIWKKQSLVLGRSPYQWQHEPILFGWKKKGRHQWYTGRKESTIWEFDKPKKNKDHPTMKPIPLLAYPILNSSMSNAIVLDPFGGSGSTLIACEQTDRICRTIELDEKFCDVIVKRYIEQVGNADGVSLQRDGLTYRYEEVAGDDAEDIPLF